MAEDVAEARLHGVWELESWRRTTRDGAVSAPYTDRPLGRIIYEPGGRMAAFMMHPGWPDAEIERGAASYSGNYRVENGEVHHLVDFANNRALIGADLVRSVTLDGDRLVLECPAVNEPGAREVLVWRPAPPTGGAR
jgi:hypothetical protein